MILIYRCHYIFIYIYILYIYAGWWFGTFFIFHNILENPSHWLIFFKIVKTTNQYITPYQYWDLNAERTPLPTARYVCCFITYYNPIMSHLTIDIAIINPQQVLYIVMSTNLPIYLLGPHALGCVQRRLTGFDIVYKESYNYWNINCKWRLSVTIGMKPTNVVWCFDLTEYGSPFYLRKWRPIKGFCGALLGIFAGWLSTWIRNFQTLNLGTMEPIKQTLVNIQKLPSWGVSIFLRIWQKCCFNMFSM